MNTQSTSLSPVELLRETDARMAQALDNFFQRSRASIQDTIFRTLATQTTNSVIAKGQTCLDWLNAHPETLSTAFADQFRHHRPLAQGVQQRFGIGGGDGDQQPARGLGIKHHGT